MASSDALIEGTVRPTVPMVVVAMAGAATLAVAIASGSGGLPLLVAGATLTTGGVTYPWWRDLQLSSLTIKLFGAVTATADRPEPPEAGPFTEHIEQVLSRLAMLLAAGHGERAADLATEALASTLVAWHRLRPDDAEAYAVRRLVELVERASLRATLVAGQGDTAELDWARAAAALAELPVQGQAVAALVLIEGRSPAQAATLVGCSLHESETYAAEAARLSSQLTGAH